MLRYLSMAAMTLIFAIGVASAADRPAPTELVAMVDGDAPCATAGVLGTIKGRFAWAERSTWHRGFVMASIGNPRPSGHPYAEPGLVKRDYCVADAVMTDGNAYPVYYAVEHGLGFAGLGRYVDFCVLGLDPWHVHDGGCRTVK